MKGMNFYDLSARVKRLDQLSRGLAKEEVLIRRRNDPLLYFEQKAYLLAIQDALSWVEAGGSSWPRPANHPYSDPGDSSFRPIGAFKAVRTRLG
jgi:hypothetical protein